MDKKRLRELKIALSKAAPSEVGLLLEEAFLLFRSSPSAEKEEAKKK